MARKKVGKMRKILFFTSDDVIYINAIERPKTGGRRVNRVTQENLLTGLSDE